MALRTGQQYVEDLKKQRRTMYAFGEKISDDWLEHPLIKPALNCMKLTYEFALLPEYEDLMTTKSHLTGEKINRFNSILSSTADYTKRIQEGQETMASHGGCNACRCTASITLNTLYNITYIMDEKLGTHYHGRFLEFLKEIHSKDLALSAGMTDVKGNRSKRPSQQDPDMYVHVVERKDSGIIIRGAKAHQSLAMLGDYCIVCPTVLVHEDEKDYAVACAVPSDAEGVVHILQCPSSDYKRFYDDLDIDLGNAKYGSHLTSIVIFNDVFVPWEKVFMCGEYQFAPDLLMDFSRHQRLGCADCKVSVAELMVGAGAAIAEYNGLDWRRVTHIRDKIMDIIQKASLVRGCVMGAITQGETSPSGVWLPDILFTDAARFYATDLIFDSARNLIDIAGGLVCTLPSERDLRNPKTEGYLKKYLKGREDISVEDRMRMFRFIEYISGLAGCIMPTSVHAGGSPEVRKLNIQRRANVERLMERAKKLAEIKGNT